MKSPPFVLRTSESDFQAFDKSKTKPMLHIKPKQWESEFFNRSFGHLSIDVDQFRGTEPEAEIWLWQNALEFADEHPYDILEMVLDIKGFDMAPLCEDFGFRLVDSKVSFLTRIDKSAIKRFEVKTGHVGLIEPRDLDAVVALTQVSFVENSRFFSRFKNQRYFSGQESQAYYAAWITNHIDDPKSIFAVWRHQGQCIGYYFYRHLGSQDGLPVYKGMLAAVDRRYQNQKAHVAMQTFLFDHFSDPLFYVDNTTQLSNFPVIKNHITSQRKLKKLELIFYRTRPLSVV